MDKSAIHINGRAIGAGRPAYVIAEMSANHGQSLDRALKLFEAAKSSGADAIKIQTYTADTITLDSDNEPFQIRKGTIGRGRTLHSLYAEAHTPWEWHPELAAAAGSLGLDFFSTPFDFTAVDLLERIGVPAYKIASFEVVDIPLLQAIARTGKPIIMSTGMASLPEIEEAVAAVRSAGNTELALLKCTSAYPAPPEDMNLRTIPDLARRFGTPIGLSDHTMGPAAPIAAVALGACIVEKHFTLSRRDPGPDSAFSTEPAEFKAMVEAIRQAERSLGSVTYELSPGEVASREFRRSLFVVRDMKAGEAFTPQNVRSIRPGHGLHPRHYSDVLTRRAAADITRGTPLDWSLVQ